MPKLTISRKEWLEAATNGDIAQLQKWRKSGALETRYDPVSVHASPTAGRPKIFDVYDDDNNSALHTAIRFGQVEYAKALMKIAPFADRANKKGETAVHLTLILKEKGTELLYALKEAGYNLDTPDKKGNTPLHWAIGHHNVDNFKFLVEQGVSLNTTDDVGRTALHRVAILQKLEMTKILLENGVNPNILSDGISLQETALHALVIGMNGGDWLDDNNTALKIFRLLINHGADETIKFKERDGNFYTLEDLARNDKATIKMQEIYAEREAALLSQATPVVSATPRSSLRL